MKCNTCGSENSELLFSNSLSDTVRMKNVPRDVLICRDCGQVYLDISGITEADLGAYYTNFNPFEAPGALVEDHQAMRQGQCSWVIDNLKKHDPAWLGSRLLEVGCGTGFLLKLFADEGLDAEGVEFSARMAENVNKVYGLKCRRGGFDASELSPPYHVIASVTVLEHVWDPNAMVADFNDLLEDGGFLYLEVPDAEFPRADMIPDHLAFEHIHHWTERTLGRLLNSKGFKVLQVAHIENTADSGNPEAVLRIFAQKGGGEDDRYRRVNDYAHEKAVLQAFRQEHVRYKQAIQDKIRAFLKQVGAEPFAIYCGGLHTSALLQLIDFDGQQPQCIFDGDPAIAGRKLDGIPVFHSSAIPEHQIRHFLLSTTNHERSIHAYLKSIDSEFHVAGLYTDFEEAG